MQDFASLVDEIRARLDNGATIYICGNGGSAAQADHFAGELVCSGFRCVSLNNLATITAIANDYAYDEVYSAQIQTLGKAGDMLIVLSTSCESKNIKEALKAAKNRDMLTIGFTGGKDLKDCEIQHKIEANTQAVQELTLIWLHTLWMALEG